MPFSSCTYKARHKGDIFTYRFADLGIGRGERFRSLGLGQPDWSNVVVIGDKILWSEVLPAVDVTVRYIHDILKVDVKDNLVGYANNALSPPYSATNFDGNDTTFNIPKVTENPIFIKFN